MSGRQAVLAELNSPGRNPDGSLRQAIDINSADPIASMGAGGLNSDGTTKSLQQVIDGDKRLLAVYTAAKDHGLRISPESNHYRPKQADVGRSVADVADARKVKQIQIETALKAPTPKTALKAIGGVFDESDLGRYTKGLFTQTEMGELARKTKSTLQGLTGLVGAGLVGGVLLAGNEVFAQTRKAIAAQRDIPESDVSTADITAALGVDLSPTALAKVAEGIATGAAGDAAISIALGPIGVAKKLWDLFQSGDDVGGLIKLLAGVYKGNQLLQNMAGVVSAVEDSAAYKALTAARQAGSEIAQSVIDAAKSLFDTNGGAAVTNQFNVPSARAITDALAGDARQESATSKLGHTFPDGATGTSKWIRLKNGTRIQELRNSDGNVVRRNYWKGAEKVFDEVLDPNIDTSQITTYKNGKPAHTATLDSSGAVTNSQVVPNSSTVGLTYKPLDDFKKKHPNLGADGELQWDWSTATIDTPSIDTTVPTADIPTSYTVRDTTGTVTRQISILPALTAGQTRWRETIRGPNGEAVTDWSNGPIPGSTQQGGSSDHKIEVRPSNESPSDGSTQQGGSSDQIDKIEVRPSNESPSVSGPLRVTITRADVERHRNNDGSITTTLRETEVRSSTSAAPSIIRQRKLNSNGEPIGKWKTEVHRPAQPIISGAQIGAVFGTVIGQAIGGDNIFAKVAAGSALATALAAVGSIFDPDGALAAFDQVTSSFSTADGIGQAFATNIANQGIGALSAFLAAELAESLGVNTNSFGGKLFSFAATTTTSTLIKAALNNVAAGTKIFAGFSGELFGQAGSGALFTNVSVGTFIGSYLGSKIVTPKNLGGSIGATVLSSLGGIIAGATAVVKSVATAIGVAVSSVVGTVLSVALPVIGSLIGFVFGAKIGSAIDRFFAISGDTGHGIYTAYFDQGAATTAPRVVRNSVSDVGFGETAQKLSDATSTVLRSLLPNIGGQLGAFSVTYHISARRKKHTGGFGRKIVRYDYVQVNGVPGAGKHVSSDGNVLIDYAAYSALKGVSGARALPAAALQQLSYIIRGTRVARIYIKEYGREESIGEADTEFRVRFTEELGEGYTGPRGGGYDQTRRLSWRIRYIKRTVPNHAAPSVTQMARQVGAAIVMQDFIEKFLTIAGGRITAVSAPPNFIQHFADAAAVEAFAERETLKFLKTGNFIAGPAWLVPLLRGSSAGTSAALAFEVATTVAYRQQIDVIVAKINEQVTDAAARAQLVAVVESRRNVTFHGVQNEAIANQRLRTSLKITADLIDAEATNIATAQLRASATTVYREQVDLLVGELTGQVSDSAVLTRVLQGISDRRTLNFDDVTDIDSAQARVVAEVNATLARIDALLTTIAEEQNAVLLTKAKTDALAVNDLFVNRAIRNSPATTAAALAGDIQTAKDYLNYHKERLVIDALIDANPDSVFAAGWLVTLLRAEALKLDELQTKDFDDGLAGYLKAFTNTEDALGRFDGGSLASFEFELVPATEDVPASARLIFARDETGAATHVHELPAVYALTGLKLLSSPPLESTTPYSLANVAITTSLNTQQVTVPFRFTIKNYEHMAGFKFILTSGDIKLQARLLAQGPNNVYRFHKNGFDAKVEIDASIEAGLTASNWTVKRPLPYQRETIGTAGNDLWIDSGATPELAKTYVVRLGAGDDIAIHKGRKNAVIYGGDGNDIILGSPSSFAKIFGGAGNDILRGGAGYYGDTVSGGSGDDTFLYELGNRIDFLQDSSGNDRVVFGTGITPDMLSVTRDIDDLVIEFKGEAHVNDRVLVLDWFDVAKRIESFVFADGTVLVINEDLTRVATRVHQDGTGRTVRTYNADGLKTVEAVYNDDGSKIETFYYHDAPNEHIQTVIEVDVAGHRTLETHLYRDGRSTVFTGDVEEKDARPYSVASFNAGGVKTRGDTYNDDGTHIETLYYLDQIDEKDRSTATYNSDDVLMTETVYWRDGERTQWIYHLDADDPTYSTVQSHNSQNELYERYIYYDNDSYQATIYYLDPADREDRLVEEYNSDDILTFQTLHYDDGTSVETTYDVDDTEAWQERSQTYDADDVLTAETGIYDDGMAFTTDVSELSDEAAPLALDLNGDGVKLVAAEYGAVQFDLNADGRRDLATGWISAEDAWLTIDANRDGQISETHELVFTELAPGTTSDLEAVRIVFDTNGNNQLDAGDLRWSDFRVWQDVNQDGVSDAGELRTLDEAGIVAIDLKPTGEGSDPLPDGTRLQARSTYTDTAGNTLEVGDAIVAFEQTPEEAILNRMTGRLGREIQEAAIRSAASEMAAMQKPDDTQPINLPAILPPSPLL